jgi:hypothetical protein
MLIVHMQHLWACKYFMSVPNVLSRRLQRLRSVYNVEYACTIFYSSKHVCMGVYNVIQVCSASVHPAKGFYKECSVKYCIRFLRPHKIFDTPIKHCSRLHDIVRTCKILYTPVKRQHIIVKPTCWRGAHRVVRQIVYTQFVFGRVYCRVQGAGMETDD